MSQTVQMPRPKVRTAATEKAEKAAVAAYRAKQVYDEERKQAGVERAAAIRAALDAGSTYARLAELMGVSPGRVQQMVKASDL